MIRVREDIRLNRLEFASNSSPAEWIFPRLRPLLASEGYRVGNEIPSDYEEYLCLPNSETPVREMAPPKGKVQGDLPSSLMRRLRSKVTDRTSGIDTSPTPFPGVIVDANHEVAT